LGGGGGGRGRDLRSAAGRVRWACIAEIYVLLDVKIRMFAHTFPKKNSNNKNARLLRLLGPYFIEYWYGMQTSEFSTIK
jgi:hypothetical protein